MDKMPYYEPPYPEETHYSHTLRLAKQNGFNNFLNFASQYLMFGGDPKGANFRDSSINMAPFFASTDISVPYSDYVFATTAYAYHAIFLNEYRSRKYLNRIYKIGNRFLYQVLMDKSDLCYCPECMREGLYFRRIHQIPYVNVCPIHGVPLYVCKNPQYHEFNDNLIGEQIQYDTPFDTEYKVALFIDGIMRSEIELSLNDYRNIVLSKIGNYTQYMEFAENFMDSEFCYLFNDKDSVYRFIKAGMRQGKVPEGEAIGILAFLFKDPASLFEYYNMHKYEYSNNTINEADFMDFIEKRDYELISDYGQNMITLRHKVCHKAFITNPSMFMDGWFCPHCSKNMSDTEFQRQIVEYSGQGEYTLIKGANSVSERITMHHNRCDRNISPTLDDFLFRGYKCSCNNKIILSDAQEIIRGRGDFELIKFSKSYEPVEVKCNKCGFVHKYKDFSSARTIRTCRACNPIQKMVSENKKMVTTKRKEAGGAKITYKNDINYARSIIYNLVGDEYNVIDFQKDKSSSHYNVKVRHAECGKEYWTSYQGFLHGSRCQCEGLGVQASSEELKRYISDLSNGKYVCCDQEITDRHSVQIKNTATGEIHKLSYRMAVQELKRITPSSIIPCDNVNRNAIKPRSAPMFFMEYLKNTYGSDGVFFSRDIVYDASKAWIASTLNMFIKQGYLLRLGYEIWVFTDMDIDWDKITRLFYVKQNNIRHGCTYGRSFLQELNIPVKYPPKNIHIMSNRKGRMASAKSSQTENTLIRKMGSVEVRVKEAPCEITEDNYKVLQVADYFSAHHNQNYPWLTEEEMDIIADYIKDVPISVVNTVTALYPKPVQDKIKSMVL